MVARGLSASVKISLVWLLRSTRSKILRQRCGTVSALPYNCGLYQIMRRWCWSLEGTSSDWAGGVRLYQVTSFNVPFCAVSGSEHENVMSNPAIYSCNSSLYCKTNLFSWIKVVFSSSWFPFSIEVLQVSEFPDHLYVDRRLVGLWNSPEIRRMILSPLLCFFTSRPYNKTNFTFCQYEQG